MTFTFATSLNDGVTPTHPALRQELLTMQTEDLRVREDLATAGRLGEGYNPQMREVHERNADRLELIIAEHGWPGRSLVGDDGAEAAWMVVQHAIGRPDLMRRSLTLLKDAADRGEAPRWQAAYVLDRICMFEGRPQIYGTQFRPNDAGEPTPHDIEDPEQVDLRRRRVGLEPLAEKISGMRAQARAEGRKLPADPTQLEREYQAWLRAVGWRR